MTQSSQQPYSQLSLFAALSLLRVTMTPATVIHIGAGRGVGGTQVWRDWDVPRAIIIDADNGNIRRAEMLCEQNLEWRAINRIVADITGEVEYHRASNADEDSLFPTEKLKHLWPNIGRVESQRCTAIRLDDILAELDFEIADFPAESVWTIVDCLPAERILSGAGSCLNRFGVVVTRVLLPTSTYTAELGQLSTVSKYLQNTGMICISVSESNHPAIGYAVYVRDWRLVFQSLHKKQQHLAEELTLERIATVTTTRANQEKISELMQMTLDHGTTINEQKNVIKNYQEQFAELKDITRQQNLTIFEQKHRVEALEKISETYKCSLAECQALINTLEGEHNRQSLIIEERERDRAALQQRVEECNEDLTILRSATDQYTIAIKDREAEIESVSNQFEAQTKVVEEYQAQIDVLTSENGQQNLTILEQQHQVEALEKIVEQYNAQVVALSIEQVSQIELLAKRQIQLAKLQVERDEQEKILDARAKALDDMQQQAEVHIAEVDRIRSDIAEQSQLQNERLFEIEKLANELAICTTRANELQQQNDLLVPVAAQVEGYRSQIATVSNNLMEMQTQYDLNMRATEEQTNRADVLSVELETINRSLATFRDEYPLVINERDALLASSKTILNDLNAKSLDLEQAQSELERLRLDSERAIEQYKEQIARQQGFQTEFVRAEAQIELIKDLFLRESGL